MPAVSKGRITIHSDSWFNRSDIGTVRSLNAFAPVLW